jgi:hypothetical protein
VIRIRKAMLWAGCAVVAARWHVGFLSNVLRSA